MALVSNQATCTTPSLASGTLPVGGHGLTATYNPSGEYLTSTSATLTHTVSKRTVAGAFTASNQAYDGNTSATIATRIVRWHRPWRRRQPERRHGHLRQQEPRCQQARHGQRFHPRWRHAGNYQLDSSSLTTLADITAHGVTVGFTAASKEYDGTRAATITSRTLSGVVLVTR